MSPGTHGAHLCPIGRDAALGEPLVEAARVLLQLVLVLLADVDRQAGEPRARVLKHVLDLPGAQQSFDHVGTGLADADRVDAMGRLGPRRAVVHRQAHGCPPVSPDSRGL
jgi:hypothetical protein